MHSGLFASPTYLTRHSVPRTPADLDQHTFVVLQGRERFDRLELHRRDEHVPVALRSRVTASTLGMQLRLAITGVGAIEYPLAQAGAAIAAGRLVRLLSEWITEPAPLWIVTPSRRLLARRTTAFIECLGRHFDSATSLTRSM